MMCVNARTHTIKYRYETARDGGAERERGKRVDDERKKSFFKHSRQKQNVFTPVLWHLSEKPCSRFTSFNLSVLCSYAVC